MSKRPERTDAEDIARMDAKLDHAERELAKLKALCERFYPGSTSPKEDSCPQPM